MSAQPMRDEAITTYGAIRNREIDDDKIESVPINDSKQWMKCFGGMILIAIVITVICLAIFFPSSPLQTDTPSIFGGMYSISEDTKYNVVNYQTNELNCPYGYDSYQVGHFEACYNCGAVQLYLCLLNTVEKDPRGFFGGAFNVNDCGGKQFTNPITNTFGCNGREGYHAYLAIASQTDNYCDTNVFVCLKGALDYRNLGGFYTQFNEPNGCMSCNGNVNNALINSLSCPNRYKSHQIAYAYSSGGLSGCPGCNGKAYVCELPQN